MKRILVVDDDPASGRMTKLALASITGYEVLVETMGARAVEVARVFQPDLVLLDIMMPDMDGGEVAAALLGDVELRDVKVVFLTALLKTREETRSGKHNVIAKPITAHELVAIIEHELS